MLGKNSFICAPTINIHESAKFGKNVHIKVRGTITIGKNCIFGDDVEINAENLSIGDNFFHLTPGLRIGGGGSQFKYANMTIGDRCVLHDNYINLAREVTLGDDVGLSPGVKILTHGFWNSPLEGFPCTYKGVTIGDGAIIGQDSFINIGSTIGKNVVIGANSTVNGQHEVEGGIYVGNPTRFIRKIEEPTEEAKRKFMNETVAGWRSLGGLAFEYIYPKIHLNAAIIDVVERTIIGQEDDWTDKLRDWLRRHGIKIYTDRGFKSL